MSNFGTFFLPGPTEVHPDVLEAMRQPMISHRGREFEALFAIIQTGLKPVFRTKRPIYVSSSSATGLMEAAIRNARSGAILCIVNGAFGERFADIARACGRNATVIGGEWGDPVPIDMVADALGSQRYSAMTVVHSESSTGVLTDVEPLARLAHQHDCAILVDSVSGVAAMPMETDAWELDFVFTGSQKALALPPGLAFAVASEKFIREAGSVPDRGIYFDVMEHDQYVQRNQTPNTPVIPLLYAAALQTERIMQETIERRWERHLQMSERMRTWVGDLPRQLGIRNDRENGLAVLASDAAASRSVTAVSLPVGITSTSVVEGVARRGFVIGSGYGKLKSSTFRIGHMGDHELNGLERVLKATEDALSEVLSRGSQQC